MAGGAGSVGGSSGMGQQPMGNAYAQPGGGGVPSFAQPYLSNLGGGGANPYNSGAPQQSATPSNPGAAMGMLFGGGSPFGMQQQQPYGMQPMQNPFGGQQMGQLGAANQTAQPMPQQPQQPSYMNNPDFQAYQKQEQDLGRQMNEYMQKAPMFQQLQDLQGKLRGFQQPQQGQMGDTGFNRPMPAVMPQQPDPGLMGEMGLYTPETYNVAPEIGIGDFMQRQLPGPRMGGRGAFGGRMGGGFGGRGGYGRQMPQQDYGYGQMQNQMREQAQFGQQQRQQYGGLGALQQYLQPPSYRPSVVAPLPLNPGLTTPRPPPPPPPAGQPDYGGSVGAF